MKQTVVKIDNLVKRYRELIALDHFSLEIKEGEVLGLLGPNGSGKTTAINCLLALLKYDKGDIRIFGETMTPASYALNRQIGIVPQDVAVFEELTVLENIRYFCSLYIREKSQREALVQEALEFVELGDYIKFYPKKLSGGLLRRLNIACGVVHKPRLIILDEPTVAVDPQSRNKILQRIRDLNSQGATVIYTSHYMDEVEQLCSRIVIIDKGRSIAEGTKEDLKMMIKTGETIRLEILDPAPGIVEGVKALENVYAVMREDNMLNIRCRRGGHNLISIMEYMKANGVTCGRVLSELPTLNDVFLEMTGKELRD